MIITREVTSINPASPEHNYVVVRGVRSPGRAYFSGLSRPYNWKVEEGYGLSGGWTTFRGRGIAKFTLTIELFTADDFKQWALFSEAITPKEPTNGADDFLLVQMQHPLLAAADIKAVAIEDAGVPVKAPNADRWVAEIKCIEYRRAQDALGKADKSIPAVDKGKPIPPKTDGDRFVAEGVAAVAAAKLAESRRLRRRNGLGSDSPGLPTEEP